jgi:uncharacterized protein YqgC (DUF456 family)
MAWVERSWVARLGSSLPAWVRFQACWSALYWVWISEYVERKDWKAALQATMGMMLGFTVSTVVQGILGLMMLAIFCWQVLRG